MSYLGFPWAYFIVGVSFRLRNKDESYYLPLDPDQFDYIILYISPFIYYGETYIL